MKTVNVTLKHRHMHCRARSRPHGDMMVSFISPIVSHIACVRVSPSVRAACTPS